MCSENIPTSSSKYWLERPIGSGRCDGWCSACSGSVVEITRSVRVVRAVAPDDDGVEPESQHHVANDGILPVVATLRPIRIGAQVFVEIANPRMKVTQYLEPLLPCTALYLLIRVTLSTSQALSQLMRSGAAQPDCLVMAI